MRMTRKEARELIESFKNTSEDHVLVGDEVDVELPTITHHKATFLWAHEDKIAFLDNRGKLIVTNEKYTVMVTKRWYEDEEGNKD